MYNYTFWSSNERRRVDGPHNGRNMRYEDNNSIDQSIREFIEDRVATTFEDRPDDVSGASDVPHYTIVRQAGDYCCRGEDRLLVRLTNFI